MEDLFLQVDLKYGRPALFYLKIEVIMKASGGEPNVDRPDGGNGKFSE